MSCCHVNERFTFQQSVFVFLYQKGDVLRTWQPSFTAKERERFVEVRRCCRLSVVAGPRLWGRGVHATVRRASSRWECALSLRAEPLLCQ